MKKDKKYEHFVSELQRLIDIDQSARSDPNIIRDGLDKVNKQINPEIKKLIAEYDFPTISKVGKQGSQNAFCLVQHQVEDLEFQKEFLLQAEGLPETEYVGVWYALLFDRVAVNSGLLQRFGTQCITKDGVTEIEPLEFSELETNKLRKEYNIIPYSLEEYRILMNGDDSVLDKYL